MLSTTSPLAKLIRTTEGFLIVASNAALVVVPIVTSAVPASLALKLGVILNGTTLVARQVLKAVALVSGVTGLEPVDPGANAELPIPIEEALAEIEAATNTSVAQTHAEQLTPQPPKAPEPAPAPAPPTPPAQ
jgi:hypothetical protein